jgi:glucose-6-phosphate 1-dehydrogenase
MVQNYLLEFFCMTAMEPPVSYDALSLRNETFKVLQAIRPVDVHAGCVLGQYGWVLSVISRHGLTVMNRVSQAIRPHPPLRPSNSCWTVGAGPGAPRLQPNEGILHTFLAKQPGPDIDLRPVTMDFRYDTTCGIEEPPSAYEWLLLDAMQDDQMLFPRSDWIYKAWSIVDLINARWEAEPAIDLPNYAAGSWGPTAADALLQRDGRAWLAV